MNPRPHHLALKVRDLALCERFYTEVLSLEIMQRILEQDGSVRSVWFALGGMILMLERSESGDADDESRCGAGHAREGWHLLALTILPQERGPWREKLRQAGVAITGETAYSLYFSDPENNRLALSHYPDPETATT
jgi:glyoxylase I family protein